MASQDFVPSEPRADALRLRDAEPPAPRPAVPTTCIEHQAGRPTIRLSFQIKVF
jgi:hypothetical protein